MQFIDLKSAGVTGRISSTPKTLQAILGDEFTPHYLPNLEVNPCSNPDIFVIEQTCKKPVIMEYPKIIVSPTGDSRGLVSACDYLLERARQEKLSVYSLNSSSVQKNGKSIVFFGGATNLGKTSSALELAKNGFDLFSDEKTLLDLKNLRLYGGSKSIALRKKIIQKKVGSDKEFKSIQDSYLTPKISMMILPHLDHGLKKTISYKLENSDAFWHLNKELSRRIRGDTKFINSFQYPLQSIDNEELSIKRMNLTKKLTLENGIAPADANKDGSISFNELRESIKNGYSMSEGETGIIRTDLNTIRDPNAPWFNWFDTDPNQISDPNFILTDPNQLPQPILGFTSDFDSNNSINTHMPGDLTGNLFNDFNDFAKFSTQWGNKGSVENPYCNGADINKDGKVDALDLKIFSENYLNIRYRKVD